MKTFLTSLVIAATSSPNGKFHKSAKTKDAPVTWDVSWIDVPNQSPAFIGFPPNKKYAMNGYEIVASKPKTVITATAYAVSSSFALIIGLVATIADTPQIEVPTAMRVPRRLGCLSLLFKKLVISLVLEEN